MAMSTSDLPGPLRTRVRENALIAPLILVRFPLLHNKAHSVNFSQRLLLLTAPRNEAVTEQQHHDEGGPEAAKTKERGIGGVG